MLVNFNVGQRVKTRTGYTRGTIEALIYDSGSFLQAIDVRSDAGPLYRNCIPDNWTDEADPTVKDRKVSKLERGDKCYVTFVDGLGVVLTFNGSIIMVRNNRSGYQEYFVAFDDGMKSQWCSRASITPGEAPDE